MKYKVTIRGVTLT